MNKQTLTPLFTKVLEYANKEVTCFDVPGHKRSSYLTDIKSSLGDMIFKFDVNSSKTVDNLSNPTGVIKESEMLLADAYKCSNAFMLVNGSTSGVQYMLMSALNHGDKVLLPRNVHKSAINALILSGAKPIFIEPIIDSEYGIVNGVTPEAVSHALDLYDDIKAVLVIHPTYFGATSNLEKIIEISHSRNIPVLVDQAHGAHFSFQGDLPSSATCLGADLVTVSMHKTGGSFTQSSALLHNEGIIPKHKVRSTINLLQTTSASYLLMSSIDVARKMLAVEGDIRLSKLLQLTRYAKSEINKIPGISCIERNSYIGREGVYDYDDLKILIKVNELGLSGFYIYDLLASEYSVQMELAEPNVVLAIVSFGDTEETINKLLNSLKDISKRFYGTNLPLERDVLSSLKKPKMLLTPRDAYYHPKKLINVKEAEHLIAGESIMVYPPGIPLIIPGEQITKEFIDHYLYLQDEGTITLNEDDNPLMIQVLENAKEANMIDLWYTENHQEDTKFSIKVKEHIHSEKSEFQQIDFFESDT
ncbi:MAG: aminotransferase class I/II-fold pyridoxal phosphate-dependent enzyme, partial [Clostridium sp.]|uniref:aminotransferase class I/II-fold pyridoxal phosphate-dependent enzyme n=1 Tax=Clostridium sp. TaxID=1506 RepID=UPI002FC73D43